MACPKRPVNPFQKAVVSALQVNLRDVLLKQSRLDAETLFKAGTRNAFLGNDRVLCQILGDKKFFSIASDIGFSSHMIFDGYWEFWLTKCFASHVNPGDHVLDIGANLGYYTLLAADLVGPEGRVLSVEPNPHVFRFLSDSVSVNGFSGRVDLINAALAGKDATGTAAFFVPNGEPKNGRFLIPGEQTEALKPLGDVFEVTVDHLSENRFERLDFVKIDVEGAEMDVVDGLKAVFDRFRPKIVCEVNFGRGYSYEDMLARLGTDGTLFHLDFDSEIKPLTPEMVATQRRHDDWLVCTHF